MDSFLDLVRESNTPKVNEMGLKDVHRLTGSHIGNARQETLDRQRRMANAPRTRSYSEVAGELMAAMKKVKRIDITMEKPNNSRTYYPKFPDEIKALMTELYNIDRGRGSSEFGKWRDMGFGDSSIHFETNAPSDYQRSHFPNGGIPENLRGTGLGYKLYRTLLKYAKYISSNSAGTREKDKAWGSLLSYKANPDGSPSIDDAHGIIGPGNWMAIDKTEMTSAEKIAEATRFIENQIQFSNTKPDRFDIDDELLAILPNTLLVKFTPEYLRSLVQTERLSAERLAEIENSRGAAEREAQERQRRQREEAAEAQRRQDAEHANRHQARITQYGVDINADWQIGDFIVVKQYLFQDYPSLPIRRVVSQDGQTYRAVTVQQAMQIEAGQLQPNNANDSRTTSDRSQWVKVNIDQIPDLDCVNLNPVEKQYIQGMLNPQAATRNREAEAELERQRLAREREANQARITKDPQRAQPTPATGPTPATTVPRHQEFGARGDMFGEMPNSGTTLKSMINARRQMGIYELLKRARTNDFVKFVVLTQEQASTGFRENYGMNVFMAVHKHRSGRLVYHNARPVDDPRLLIRASADIALINLVTGKIVDPPFTGLGLKAFPLLPVTEADKLQNRAGNHYYIAGHQNDFGIVAKSDRTTRNTANQPFIYMHAFGYGDRPVAVRLDLLRKLDAPINIDI